MLRVPTKSILGADSSSERESCYRRGCLHNHLRRRLRNRGVSDMADLAMILVVRSGCASR